MIGWRTRALLLASLVLLSACTVEPPVGAPASRVTTSAPTISAASAPSTAPGDVGAAASATPVPARSTASAPPTTLTSPTANASHAITTVFLILMENHNWSDIYQRSAAPYINTTLLPEASYAQRYYNPPNIHPSEPNYLWLEAGTNFGIANDRDPRVNHQSTSAHLVTLLTQAGISWKSYQEDISGTTCPLTSHGLYAPKHNPMVYFDDVTNSNDPKSTTCIGHVRPYAELATDLQNNTVARYNFITPNLCHDMHGAPQCATANLVTVGDTWLSTAAPPILDSPAYQHGGLLLITWDEGEGSDGPIGMIALSPVAKGGGYANTIRYTHSSTLRTIQEILDVTPLLGDAAQATDLRDLFTAFP
jgi:hypothetical protein